MKRILLPLLVTGCCWLTPLAQAASDYLLEIDGIKGESSDDVHKDSIEISSFSWGVSNAGALSGGGGSAGKVSLSDLSLMMHVNKASMQLMLSCANGQHIKSAKLFVRKAGADGKPTDYLVIEFKEVFVTSYSQSGPGGGATGGASRPVDKLVLSSNSVSVSYTADDGSVTVGSATATPTLATGN